jgi:hypothetical protein
MSALLPKADIRQLIENVRFVPEAEVDGSPSCSSLERTRLSARRLPAAAAWLARANDPTELARFDRSHDRGVSIILGIRVG